MVESNNLNYLKESIYKLLHYLKDPYFYNSFFLFLSYIIAFPLNIVFSVIANNILSTQIYGISVSLINYINWISLFSRFGIDLGLRRFLPEINKEKYLILLSMMVISISGISIGFLSLSILLFFTESYAVLHEDLIIVFLLLILVILVNLSTIFESIFISIRKTHFLTIRRVLSISTSLFFLFIFSFLEVLGYVLTILLSYIVITVFFILLIFFNVKIRNENRNNVEIKIKNIISYSIGNYIVFLFSNFSLLIPLILIILGSFDSAAYFFVIDALIRTIRLAISSLGTSFMVEGIHNPENLKKNVKKSVFLLIIILFSITLMGILFGEIFLNFYGADFVENGYLLLILSFFALIPDSINSLWYNLCYIKKRLNYPIIFVSFEAIMSLVGLILLFPKIGIKSYGIIWLTSSTLLSIVSIKKILSNFGIQNFSTFVKDLVN